MEAEGKGSAPPVRVLLLITDAHWYEPTGFADAWVRALRDEGAEVTRAAGIEAGWVAAGVPGYDLVIPHVLVEEVAAFGATMAAAALLECAGATLLNPVRALVASADKLATAAVWSGAGLPQPRTWALPEVARWPAPGEQLVLKPALGDGARHITLVGGLAQARSVAAHWRRDEDAGGERRGTPLLQEWVREPVCLRLFATPDSTSLAYEKGREPGALATSGTVYPRVFPPPPALAELARAMVASLGGGLMGVDVLIDAQGRLLALEANAPFGFDVTDPEQARFVARAALARVRQDVAA